MVTSNWIDKQVSLYSTHGDNTGRPASYRDILLTEFAKDLPAITGLRKLDITAPDYKIQTKPFKARLQCFTPAALMASKAAGQATEISRPGIMQLDFDYQEIQDYDIEDLKQCIFSLPFIAFCGLSCSGSGFYALALIAEPERLSEYASHCFEVLKKEGITPDESKGKKVENLRYVSYDANMLIRNNPEPLLIKGIKRKEIVKANVRSSSTRHNSGSNNALINKKVTEVLNVTPGNRWQIVQSASYTLGGLNDNTIINLLHDAIHNNSAFTGEEDKYLKCANVCFREGQLNPLNPV